jgi:hypothetical protein
MSTSSYLSIAVVAKSDALAAGKYFVNPME